MEQLNDVIFYTIDKAIRTYRQYAQKQFKKAGYSITIDQWLILKTILDHPAISQQELGEKVFKDNASVTRIIDLLVKAKYLKREVSKTDRRRSELKITAQGKTVISGIQKVVLKNRSTALQGVSKGDIQHMRKGLQTIIKNCDK
jgi:MarR family transcriptional regulator, transcriptional regulator for hemolysin